MQTYLGRTSAVLFLDVFRGASVLWSSFVVVSSDYLAVWWYERPDLRLSCSLPPYCFLARPGARSGRKLRWGDGRHD